MVERLDPHHVDLRVGIGLEADVGARSGWTLTAPRIVISSPRPRRGRLDLALLHVDRENPPLFSLPQNRKPRISRPVGLLGQRRGRPAGIVTVCSYARLLAAGLRRRRARRRTPGPYRLSPRMGHCERSRIATEFSHGSFLNGLPFAPLRAAHLPHCFSCHSGGAGFWSSGRRLDLDSLHFRKGFNGGCFS